MFHWGSIVVYVRDALLQESQDAGVTSHSNGASLPELGDHPADIILDNFGAGSPVAVNVSVVSGLQPYLSLATSHAGVREKSRE